MIEQLVICRSHIIIDDVEEVKKFVRFIALVK